MPAVTIILKHGETIGEDSVYIGPVERGAYNEYKEELSVRLYSGKGYTFKKGDIALFSKTVVMASREHEVVILPKEDDIDDAIKSLYTPDPLPDGIGMQQRRDLADSQKQATAGSAEKKDLPVVK